MSVPTLKKIDPAKITPSRKKKKILLLSDDLRTHSGIATVSREIVTGTVDTYDWVQVGALMQHPEHGKFVDISADVAKETGVSDASVRILGWNGYGDQNLLRQLLMVERPDAVMHFTDPRFWEWLYMMEHEIRETTPLIYLNIWDCTPDPMYNKDAYASCDLLMAISKQTYGINTRVLSRAYPDIKLEDPTREIVLHSGSPKRTIDITYVPHGINHKTFRPIDESDSDYTEYKQYYNDNFAKNGIDFIVFWNNRNINRKHPGDVILAFKTFVDNLPEDKRETVALLMHTSPIDPAGTDLTAVVAELAKGCKIIFSGGAIAPKLINFMYNSADVTISMTSNEGFGLATAESVMAGTPICVNVTGGLQDQCGFYFEESGEDYIPPQQYIELKSLHNNRQVREVFEPLYGKLKHGEWAFPVWPRVNTLQGSVPTPYIFDDIASYEDFAETLRTIYDQRNTLKQRGLKGREYFLRQDTKLAADAMCHAFIDSVEHTLANFTPTPRYELIKV